MAKSLKIALLTVLLSAHAKAETGSLFERYFTAAGGRIPFPVNQLRQALAVDQQPGIHDFVFIHSGRSVQKANTDLCHPRLVTAIETKAGTTFIGYAEKSKTAEVISWNEAGDRFEFLILKNYGPGLKPELVKAERSFCLSCHQNGGPILSRAPWRELNNPFQMKQFYERCLDNKKIDPVAGAYKEYQGVKVFESFGIKSGDPAADGGTSCVLPALNPGCKIDSAVRGSEKLLQFNRACRSICLKGDESCMEEVQRLAKPESAFSKLNEIDRGIFRRLKDNALPTTVLPDRNPNIAQAHVFLLRNGDSTNLNLEVINGDYLENGAGAGKADPQLERPKALEFLGFNFITLAERSAIDQAGALTSLVRSCLKKGPAAFIPATEEPTAAAPVDRTAPALFQHYCGKCHSGANAVVSLPLTDLNELRKVRSVLGDSPQELLRWKIMPRKAPGVPELSDTERDVLIQLLEGH